MTTISTLSSPSAPREGRRESGMLLMAVGVLLLPVLDAVAKLLTDWMGPIQIAGLRFAFQTIILGGLLMVRGRFVVPRGDLRALAFGGLLMAGTLSCFIGALTSMPLANAVAIFFVEPLILTGLSAVFLGEKVGWRRVSAILVGLAGAVVVIRPNWEAFGWVAVLPLGAAICLASYFTITRSVTARHDGPTVQFWTGASAAVILCLALGIGAVGPLSVPALTFAPAPPMAWALLLGLGVLANVTHIMIATAFRRCEASILAPFQYLEIVAATVLGYLMFGDLPDALTWTGTAIILASGAYVFHRERKLARSNG